MIAAGEVYRCRKRHVVILQVRGRDGPGLAYALVRLCGPRGRPQPSQYLGDEPLTVYLTPDGSMPAGYELAT